MVSVKCFWGLFIKTTVKLHSTTGWSYLILKYSVFCMTYVEYIRYDIVYPLIGNMQKK